MAARRMPTQQPGCRSQCSRSGKDGIRRPRSLAVLAAVVLLHAAPASAQGPFPFPEPDHVRHVTTTTTAGPASRSPDSLPPQTEPAGRPISPRSSDAESASGTGRAPGSLWGTTATLAIVVALIVGLGALARRLLPRTWTAHYQHPGVEILGRQPLNARQTLFVVRFGSRILLVGASPQSMAALGELSDPDETAAFSTGREGPPPAADEDSPAGFANWLRRYQRPDAADLAAESASLSASLRDQEGRHA